MCIYKHFASPQNLLRNCHVTKKFITATNFGVDNTISCYYNSYKYLLPLPLRKGGGKIMTQGFRHNIFILWYVRCYTIYSLWNVIHILSYTCFNFLKQHTHSHIHACIHVCTHVLTQEGTTKIRKKKLIFMPV